MTMSTTLGALVKTNALEFSDGYRTRRDQLVDSGYRILRAADVVNGVIRPNGADYVASAYASAIGAKVVREGDVVLTTKGSVGRVARVESVNEPLVYSPQVCFFRVPLGSPLTASFLRHWLDSVEFVTQAGSAMHNTDMAPYLNLRDLGAMRITIPPRARQEAISEVLGALDDKMAANRALASTADSLIGAMWGAEVRISSRQEAFFDVIHVEFGEPFGGPHFTEPGAGRPLIRIRDLTTSSSQVWTSESRAKETVVSPGDVLVGMDAEFRPHRWTGPTAVLNQRVMRVTSPSLGNALCREAVRGPLLALEGMKSATTVIHLNKSDLQVARVLVPTGVGLADLRSRAEPLYRCALGAHLENRTLAELRDTLLPQLMSGRLRVRDAGHAVADAL